MLHLSHENAQIMLIIEAFLKPLTSQSPLGCIRVALSLTLHFLLKIIFIFIFCLMDDRSAKTLNEFKRRIRGKDLAELIENGCKGCILCST